MKFLLKNQIAIQIEIRELNLTFTFCSHNQQHTSNVSEPDCGMIN